MLKREGVQFPEADLRLWRELADKDGLSLEDWIWNACESNVEARHKAREAAMEQIETQNARDLAEHEKKHHRQVIRELRYRESQIGGDSRVFG
jgi:hypothetical protein